MKDRVEKLVSISGLIVATIALYLSWQANNIAKISNEPILIVHYTNLVRQSSTGYGDLMQGEVFCDYSYLITNLGGASTSIIKQGTNFSFAASEYSEESQNTYLRHWTENDDHIEWFTSIVMTQPYTGTIFSDDGIDPIFEHLPEPYIASFPITFEAHATEEIFVRVWYKFKNTHWWGAGWDDREGYYPIHVSHNFELSNGDRLTTPTFTCYYLMPLEM